MVDVEIFEGAFVVLAFEVAFGIEGCDEEFGVLYFAGAVEVDQSHHHLQSLSVGYALLHDLLELLKRNRAVAVRVGPLENFLKANFLCICQ